ncbi:MAG: hypothetical protein FWE21_03635 [Defluviitaleaceae bacterium]|nr:hypothetical protein [Defluviitaleaceae bacterium]
MNKKSNDDFVNIEKLLEDLPGHELPMGLHDKIMRGVQADRRKRLGLRAIKSFGAVAAAAFVAVFWFGWWHQATTEIGESLAESQAVSMEYSLDDAVLPSLSPSPVAGGAGDLAAMPTLRTYDAEFYEMPTIYLEDFDMIFEKIAQLPHDAATIFMGEEENFIIFHINDGNRPQIERLLAGYGIHPPVFGEMDFFVDLIKIQ